MVTVDTDVLLAHSRAIRAQSREEAARSKVLRRRADKELERSTVLREILIFRGRWTAPEGDLRRVLVAL